MFKSLINFTLLFLTMDHENPPRVKITVFRIRGMGDYEKLHSSYFPLFMNKSDILAQLLSTLVPGHEGEYFLNTMMGNGKFTPFQKMTRGMWRQLENGALYCTLFKKDKPVLQGAQDYWYSMGAH